MKRAFVCGESYIGHTVHIKGADSMETNGYFEQVRWLRGALENAGYEVTYMPSHAALSQFPDTKEKLALYDVVILSDVGANTLLMPDRSFRESLPAPNRCEAVKEYVLHGGGFIMVGGFMSFTGIEGKARYGATPIANILPVALLPYDDRVENSSGIVPRTLLPGHPIVQGLPEDWHYFIGYNKTTPDAGRGEVVATIGGDPLIAAGAFGKGRSAVFTSDCAPHWAPKTFLDSPAYQTLWKNMADWVSKAI